MCPDRAAESDLADLVYVLVLARRGHSDLRRRRVLATHLRIAVSSLNDWESGRDAPTLLNLIRWARVFDLRVAICGESGDRPLPASTTSVGLAWESREAGLIVGSLCDVRRERRITQHELGQRLDVTAATVLRWEHARRYPRMLTLLRWARELGCVVQLRSMNNPPRRLETSPQRGV
jgi:transcriptional regulator with XRE-family HTH domain